MCRLLNIMYDLQIDVIGNIEVIQLKCNNLQVINIKSSITIVIR